MSFKFQRLRVAAMMAAGLLTLLSAPATVQAAAITHLFHFDLHFSTGGVVRGSGVYANYLFGTTADVSSTSGGTLYRVPIDGSTGPVTLKQFNNDGNSGYGPRATLMLSQDGYLYGTTHNSAPSPSGKLTAGGGTIFRIAQDGSGFETLYDFGGVTGNASIDDSVFPDHSLIEDSVGNLYGVASFGGANGTGMLFRLRKSDRNFKSLHEFGGLNQDGTAIDGGGISPSGPMTLGRSGRLFGVTATGGENQASSSSGSSGTGIIYSINTDGSDYQREYSFPALDLTTSVVTNTTGASPLGSLVETSAGTFVGIAATGGTPDDLTLSGLGTIFKYESASHTTTALHAFEGTNGASPSGRLAYSTVTGLVYGATKSGLGHVFSINPLTKAYSVVYAMTAVDSFSISDGISVGSEGDLYGATQSGGSCTQNNASGYGTVFRISVASSTTYGSYANCTAAISSSSGGGSMQYGWLAVLALLGLWRTVTSMHATLSVARARR